MVGLVLVSHSRALADALRRLVQQVASPDVSIAIAAGVGPEREEFGTDAVEIMEAILSVNSPDGVLVLMDLGSAVLSAEMALELLPPDQQERVLFCAAPLVEGAIAAAVQAGLGSDLETVCSEARQALAPKAEQLGQAAPEAGLAALEAPAPAAAGIQAAAGNQAGAEPAQTVTLAIRNAHGLHARPAARFVQTAARFDARIQVLNLTRGRGPVPAASLNALATLGAVQGDEVQVSATGPEAGLALQALSDLVAANFGEAEEEPAAALARPVQPSAAKAPDGATPAVPISEGIAIGPLFAYHPPAPEVPQHTITDPTAAWERLERALQVTRRSLQDRQADVTTRLGPSQAGIFEAHALILQDPQLLERARRLIFDEHRNEAAAWHTAIQEAAGAYQALEDAYLQQRAADVQDVGTQVLQALADKPPTGQVKLPGPVVLFAQDLTPTETAQLDMSLVQGIITVAGGPTSHSAILARAMGVPAVSGADPSLEMLPADTRVGLDGFNGHVWVDPPPEAVSELQERRQAWLDEREALLQTSRQPAMTEDGRRVEVAANVGTLQDAEMAVQNGAEAVGLLRTEFLYLTRTTPPSESEQEQALRLIFEHMEDRPVIVRTLDVGGDKDLPYIDMPVEANPFLGVRAIRLSLRRPELFLTQLRAILLAGHGHQVRVMFPMIAIAEEVRQAKAMLAGAHTALAAEGRPHLWPLETGIMVEIPAAALMAGSLAREVDFFSIGTNDLTQYTLAAERGNPALPHLADALHPAVLRLVGQVVEAAHQHGKWVGVCGELAGEPAAVPVLVGLGVDELSMNPGAIPRAKAILRGLRYPEAQALARQALEAENAEQVRQLVRQAGG